MVVELKNVDTKRVKCSPYVTVVDVVEQRERQRVPEVKQIDAVDAKTDIMGDKAEREMSAAPDKNCQDMRSVLLEVSEENPLTIISNVFCNDRWMAHRDVL